MATLIGVATTVTMVCGVTDADAANSFADRSIVRVTDDGWRITLAKKHERVHSVPPLDQSPWTREGFLTLRGSISITGTSHIPVNAGTLSSGFHIACNTDISSGVSLGVLAGPTAQMSISYPPAAIIGVQALGNISTTLRPGAVYDIPFGTKPLTGPKAGLGLEGVHIKVAGCLGPVSLRAYTRIALSTPTNDDTYHLYGQPHYL
ncbi:MspA family porin [Gordonia sp. X0973]|uniref:MspA family porin n=1 Tax=Gordonia sp. X0973 TaxID=2742602 RepID=UPI00265752FD|nr:MspA family porin [Gordonia sp. X0973]